MASSSSGIGSQSTTLPSSSGDSLTTVETSSDSVIVIALSLSLPLFVIAVGLLVLSTVLCSLWCYWTGNGGKKRSSEKRTTSKSRPETHESHIVMMEANTPLNANAMVGRHNTDKSLSVKNSNIMVSQVSKSPTGILLEESLPTSEFEDIVLPRHRQFMPKYGLMVPKYDFTTFNMSRNKEDKDFSYCSRNLLLVRNICVGRFGKILLMKANGIGGYNDLIPVVVKFCHRTNKREEFHSEVELLKRFIHPNVVSLLGVCEDSDYPLMIQEYMSYGDLKSFLQDYGMVNQSLTSPTKCLLTVDYFYRFALDVASALDFLSKKSHVYGNVAAKNCLVGAGIRVKITNFSSLSQVSAGKEQREESEDDSRFRWMAPESLLQGKYTTASDVWSYGVLLWEIVSYGQTPLKGKSLASVLKEAANGTLIHSRPDKCPDDIYSMMTICFKYDAGERPSFQDILNTFCKRRSSSVVLF